MSFIHPPRKPAQKPPEVAEEVFSEVGCAHPVPPFFRKLEEVKYKLFATQEGLDHFRPFPFLRWKPECDKRIFVDVR